MVKAIAEHLGVKMPGLFGFIPWSCLVLITPFVLLTALFFWRSKDFPAERLERAFL